MHKLTGNNHNHAFELGGCVSSSSETVMFTSISSPYSSTIASLSVASSTSYSNGAYGATATNNSTVANPS
eukprot:CAMPEP_0202697912 /NCGR_PEP_ID=MMETSP1385-20130828/11216_1 /ASSEMBLY_ACC=CAM_ASM_000861 /TAXON_ID=933848 /ORGANISM="Elphidium margaritaceum" /LENGTH=69 /DNA_ID=CAMNT_0049354491 /DNA_START=138 /DNA_END=343 /DNA_ORIENTATION=-